MDVTLLTPAPGTAKVGDLLVDQATRQLWLGVDAAIDPNEVILISDMLQLEADIAAALSEANDYTDAQILTRAPLSHTHLSAQITDFSSAVVSVVTGLPGFAYVTGMVMMYSGSLANIGVGALAGWALCDGSNGTPDLRDRFVIGAGNKATGDKNTTANIETNTTGGHKHTNVPTALTVAQMPPHTHSVSGSFSGSGAAYTDTHGGHQHPNAYNGVPVPSSGGWGYRPAGGGTEAYTGVAGAHNHYVSMAVSGSISGTAASAGSGATHTHDMDIQGDHKHTITPLELREKGIAYFALAFIMKL